MKGRGPSFPQAGSFSYSENCLECGKIRVNMRTRRFAFAPPCGLLSASGACSATTEAERRNRPYIGRMAICHIRVMGYEPSMQKRQRLLIINDD